jgi:hypothetical protein
MFDDTITLELTRPTAMELLTLLSDDKIISGNLLDLAELLEYSLTEIEELKFDESEYGEIDYE